MIPVYFNPHSVWFISDAMAERGDLIGCTVLFEIAENGEVPISFTLNGKPITQARVSIRIFQEDSLLFPFVSMGHEGVAVSAKVSNIFFFPAQIITLRMTSWWHIFHQTQRPRFQTVSLLCLHCRWQGSQRKEKAWYRGCKLNAPANGFPQDMEERLRTTDTAETCLALVKI